MSTTTLGPSEKRATSRRRYELRRKYGLTLEQYDALLARQGGGCAICGAGVAGGRGRFHVDHDHETDEIRGLLCTNCNLMLGYAKDSIQSFRRAITYLTEPLLDLDDVVEIYGLS